MRKRLLQRNKNLKEFINFKIRQHWSLLLQLTLLFMSFPDERRSNGKVSAHMWETWVRSREDPLEKEMATHSGTLAWKILWTEKPGRLQSMGSQRVGHDWVFSLSLSFFSWVISLYQVMFKKKKNYLAASRLWHEGSSSLTRDWTQTPCIGSVEF